MPLTMTNETRTDLLDELEKTRVAWSDWLEHARDLLVRHPPCRPRETVPLSARQVGRAAHADRAAATGRDSLGVRLIMTKRRDC